MSVPLQVESVGQHKLTPADLCGFVVKRQIDAGEFGIAGKIGAVRLDAKYCLALCIGVHQALVAHGDFVIHGPVVDPFPILARDLERVHKNSVAPQFFRASPVNRGAGFRFKNAIEHRAELTDRDHAGNLIGP
jgi:hypothetical protein